MKAKTIVTGVLLLFVAVSVVYLIAERNAAPEGEVREGSDPADGEFSSREAGGARVRTGTAGAPEIVVYYFHGARRCATCRTIEAYAEEAIRTGFPADLASGKLEWRVVNLDEPENAHFIQDFQLASRSVVLVEMENGAAKRWKSLEKVWQLVRSKPEFTDYVVENTREFTAGGDE